MKVKDIMAKDVKIIPPDMSAKDALDLLFTMKISGLPVIGEQDKLLGMFTEKDILRALLPSYLHQVGSFVYTQQPKGIKNKVAELVNIKVKDIMRKEVVTLDEDVSLYEAARVIMTRGARRLPVLNKAGKVVGMLARQDVIKALIESEVKL